MAPQKRRLPGPRVTFTRPPLDGLVTSLLESVPTGHPARALAVEVWADRLATTLYAPGEMPEEFYGELAEALLAASHPEARPAIAALAHALAGTEADPLRRAHAEFRARLAPGDDSDLGIGRAVALSAVEIGPSDVENHTTLLVDFAQPTAPHSLAIQIDAHDGRGTDLHLGPAGVGEGDEIGLTAARARYEMAIDLTDRDPDAPVAEEFHRTRPLGDRRMALLPEPS